MSTNEILLYGDSHTITLHEGMKRHGISPAIFQLPGGALRQYFWKQAKAKRVKQTVEKRHLNFSRRHGKKSIFDFDCFVLVSIGFQLSPYAHAFDAYDHRVIGYEAFENNPRDGYKPLSSQFIRDYVADNRENEINFLKRFNEKSSLLVVAAPRTSQAYSSRVFLTEYLRLLEDNGIEVFDPNEMLGVDEDGLLDRKWVGNDGYHGTDEYGEAVVKLLIEQKKIPV